MNCEKQKTEIRGYGCDEVEDGFFLACEALALQCTEGESYVPMNKHDVITQKSNTDKCIML
jgi:hypothetical protein